jgi:hypothetical protein
MQICFYHLLICVLPLEIQLSRWDPIIKLIPSQARTGISNVICRVCFEWEVINADLFLSFVYMRVAVGDPVIKVGSHY